MNWVSIQHVNDEIINNFSCSDEPDVEEFFKRQAKFYDSELLAKTQVLLDNQIVVGFFTLFNEDVMIGVKKAKNMELNLFRDGFNHFPAVRLHYLGVDDTYRKKGYGKKAIGQVFWIIEKIAKQSGCSFITVEASNRNIVEFNTHFGFKMLKEEPRRKIGKKDIQHMIFRVRDLLN